jgi:hypothetical protein
MFYHRYAETASPRRQEGHEDRMTDVIESPKKLSFFVLFASSFVVKFAFSFLVAASPLGPSG